MSVLELHEVTRTHGSGESAVHALRAVTLSVAAGELLAVTGASGSGKSTLLNLAGGLDTPDGGEVRVGGRSLRGLSRAELARVRRRTIGYIFQAFNLVPSLTALENVALPLELDGMNRRRAGRLAADALVAVELGELGGRFPDELSGGQQQRVAIARALVGERTIVLADEPTGALDSATGDAVLALLHRQVQRGAAGVLVTHDQAYAERADRVVRLHDGRVIDEFRPAARRPGRTGPAR
jgi:putative ABC transport system ATP-binding protein